MKILRLAVQQVKVYKGLFLLLVLGLISGLIAYYVSITLYGKIIDEAIIKQDAKMLGYLLAMMVGIGILDFALASVQDFAASRLRSRIETDMRHNLFRHMQRQSPDFYARFDQARLLSRFSNDIPLLQEGIVRLFVTGIGSGVSVIAGLSVMFYLNWSLAVVCMAGIVLLFLPSKLLQPKGKQFNEQYLNEMEQNANVIHEQLRGHTIISAIGLQSYMTNHFNHHLARMASLAQKKYYISYSMNRLSAMILSIVAACIIGYGGYLTFEGAMTAGDLVIFMTILLTVGSAAHTISTSVPRIIEANVASDRILEISQWKPAIEDRAGSVPLKPLASSISWHAVNFAYKPEHPILKDISLVIPTNRMTAIVGTSGAGKSTMLHLMLRLYDPDAGEIRYDGIELRNIQRQSLQRENAAVFQETFLFDTTILDNIRISRPDADESEVIAAARAVGIHDAIMNMPSGYQTQVGNHGGSLSGGQRQRIAIARALLHRPSVLLLDEATSALDAETEAEVNATIRNLSQQMTVVFVTHRLYSASEADQIIVLQDGRIVESGVHESLLHAGGRYRQLWDKQTGVIVSNNGAMVKIKPEHLARMPIFQGIGEELLEKMTTMFVVEHYEANQRMIREGDIGNTFYVIARGKVKVTRSSRGVEEPLAILEDGDHVGEIALFRNIARTASVTTMTPAILLSLSQKNFMHLVDGHPNIRSYLEETIARRIH